MKNFFLKLNWRLIVIHILASWLFLCAFREFVLMHDYSYQYVYSHNNKAPDEDRIMNNLYWNALSGVVGLLVAFIISFILSLRKRWFWPNSVIVFILGILSSPFILRLNAGYYINYLLGGLITVPWKEFMTIGIMLLLPGLILLLSKIFVRLIDKAAYKNSI